jgi:hypothetical protein
MTAKTIPDSPAAIVTLVADIAWAAATVAVCVRLFTLS